MALRLMADATADIKNIIPSLAPAGTNTTAILQLLAGVENVVGGLKITETTGEEVIVTVGVPVGTSVTF